MPRQILVVTFLVRTMQTLDQLDDLIIQIHWDVDHHNSFQLKLIQLWRYHLMVPLPHLGLLPRMPPHELPYHILISVCVHHDLLDVIYILHGSLSLLPLLVQVLYCVVVWCYIRCEIFVHIMCTKSIYYRYRSTYQTQPCHVDSSPWDM